MTVRKLKNAVITHVSYVDRGANKKQFFLTKSLENPTIEKNVKILVNKEDAKQLVYGVVYEPNVPDAHNDMMDAEEIEKAAHRFLADYRNIDKQHDFQSGYGEVVESYIAPQDFEIGGEVIKKGSWVLVTKANDETWEAIKRGEITGYSMAGIAEVEEVEVEKQEDKQVNKFFQMMKEFFTKEVVEKEEEHKEEETGLKKEDLQELLKEAMAPINEKLEALEKQVEKAEKAEEVVEEKIKKEEETKEEDNKELLKQLSELIKEELAPINERLEKVEKARGISKSVEADSEGQEDKEESVYKSLFTFKGQL